MANRYIVLSSTKQDITLLAPDGVGVNGKYIHIQAGTATTGNNTGGSVVVYAGPGSGTSPGGFMNFIAGTGGGTSGTGGGITIRSGMGGTSGGAGGALVLEGNAGSGSGTSGNITIRSLNSGTTGTVLIRTGNATSAQAGSIDLLIGSSFAGAGNHINLRAGKGGSSSDLGGNIYLDGGEGGEPNGTGGNLELKAGLGGSINGSGGNVNIEGGTSYGTGSGGNIAIYGGQGFGGGPTGNIIISTYSSGSSVAGDISVTAGNSSSGSFEGGDINVTAGNGGVTSGEGGDITLTSGVGKNGTGGTASKVIISAGAVLGRFGGRVDITGGNGQTGINGVSGGGITLQGGISGDGASVGRGGDITILGGSGNATRPGGDMNIMPGIGGSGTGAGGNLLLYGATGGATGGNGSFTELTSGSAGNTTGNAGNLIISAGDADGGNGGSIGIEAGSTNTGSPGSIAIQAGQGPTSGGTVSIIGGAADTGPAGQASLEGGESTVAGPGGNALIDGGLGASGTNGIVNIGTIKAEAINIGRIGKLTTILGNYAAAQLPASGVVAGTYPNATVTVDASGRVTNISVSTSSGVAYAPFLLDQDLNPNNMSSLVDDFDTGLTLSVDPALFTYVGIRVNGIGYTVAQNNAQRATSDFYFGNVSGIAKNMMGLGNGDKLFCNGVVSGLMLATSDSVDLVYSVPAPVKTNPSLDNKKENPTSSQLILADSFDTGLTLGQTPALQSRVSVRLNGQHFSVALDESERTTSVFYLSDDAGVTAKSMLSLTTGDALFFNGIVAGFLMTTTDEIDIVYNIVSSISTHPTLLDKNLTPSNQPSLTNSFFTGIALSSDPVGYTGVLLDGEYPSVAITSGDQATSVFYFSDDGGLTAKDMVDFTIGDELYFNGIVAGFQLSTSNRIDLDYEEE